jgi:type 1 fimbria pilin
MNIKKTLLATCLLAASANALAATTADLKVTGKVVPASCDVTIGTGAPVDLGDIQVSALNTDPDKPTALTVPAVPYNITCTGPVAISTSWVDNQEADGTYPATGVNLFSLGKDAADAPIGHLWIQHGGGAIVAVTGNGAETHANVITSADGITWVDSSYGQASKTQINSFAPAGASTPAAYTTYSGRFTLKPSIAPVNELDLSTSLNINANATMELSYL